jgi:hypothetical protein
MDIRFQPHNLHLEDPALFRQQDPHLRRLNQQALVHHSALLADLPRTVPGIYTLGGGRQIGKSTLLKQWMQELLEDGIAPSCLRYLTGELIDDHHALTRLLTALLEEMPDTSFKYVILDEVSYIKQWDKAVKYIADAGYLEDTALVLTGSDLLVIQEARVRFPGRRGRADRVDFHLHPLSFAEVVQLKGVLTDTDKLEIQAATTPLSEILEETLLDAWTQYLGHGGFLTAINDLAQHDRILPATLAIYSDWIRGDLLKRGKQEHFISEVLGAIVKRHGTQVSWNALARDLSIDHPATVSDYIQLLTTLDVVFVQAALMEDKLVGAPKKARKVVFKDPFIYHAIRSWLAPSQRPYEDQILPCLDNPEQTGLLTEASVVCHFARHFPTYYIKAEGEVDLAYIKQERFWPLEIKWTAQLRPKSLKQIAKYPNSRILSRRTIPAAITGVPVDFLPAAILRLEWERAEKLSN